LLGSGNGTFQPAVTYGSGGYYAFSVAVADVNGDGKPDLVAGNACETVDANDLCIGSGDVGVLLGNGDGTFHSAVAYGSGGDTAFSVAVADVNGDGKPDLVVGNECGGANCEIQGVVGVLINTTITPAPKAPTSKEQCKHGGYKKFGPPAGPFKNQGECVSYVEHHDHDHDH
jgi:hypothetical protein